MADLIFNVLQAADGEIGEICLNRPEALNALTFDMIMAMLTQLTTWQKDNNIKAVLVRSMSDKAFCAGGDVVSLYHQGKENIAKALPFFKHEYRLNCLIRHYSKPYISLLDGITMGGGVGISLHGRYPLATENFSFAMPETGIGFFPDVGGGYILSRANRNFGLYLGLTGLRIGRSDALHAGIIKHTLKSNQCSEFIAALQTCSFADTAFAVVELLVQQFKDDAIDSAALKDHQQEIDSAFSLASVEMIFKYLADSRDPWSQKTFKLLQKKAPLSLKITYEQLRRCQDLDLLQTMMLEYRLVNRFMAGNDFYEGVRALLIDKDKAPCWQPSKLEQVTTDDINAYFKPLAQEFSLT